MDSQYIYIYILKVKWKYVCEKTETREKTTRLDLRTYLKYSSRKHAQH